MVWNPYRRIRRTEPSMRDEMEHLLDGLFPEISKKQPALIRKFRRDSLRKLIPCDCVDLVTKEPDLDTFCPFCQGEGAYWDEGYIDVYKVNLKDSDALKEGIIGPGLINVPLMVFYTRSSVDLTKEDKIVELVLDTEGAVATPVRRAQLYRISTLVDYRSDNGRLEYWKVACYGENRKFLNGPNI